MNVWTNLAQERDTRIARVPETCYILGVSHSTVRNRLKKNGRWYDPNFPKPLRLGSGPRCAIGWRVDELQAYIAGKRLTDQLAADLVRR